MQIPFGARTLKVSIIIPAYNERSTIEEAISRVKASPVEKEIIVADDGSTDGTAEIVSQIEGVILVRNERNAGKGLAIRKALPCATGDIILIQDADLEYDPQDYPKIIEPISRNEADVVYGSRFLAGRPPMKLPNFIANKIFAYTATILYKHRVTDEGTAYKAFRAELLKNLDLRCKRFEFCPEVTARLLKRGVRYKEVPISYTPRTTQEGKKIGFLDGLEILWALIKYRFKG